MRFVNSRALVAVSFWSVVVMLLWCWYCRGIEPRLDWLVDSDRKGCGSVFDAKPSSIRSDAVGVRSEGQQVFLNCHAGDNFAALLIALAKTEFNLRCHVVVFRYMVILPCNTARVHIFFQ